MLGVTFAAAENMFWAQVWISLTAFLHFVGQQESFDGSIEHLGKSERLPRRDPDR